MGKTMFLGTPGQVGRIDSKQICQRGSHQERKKNGADRVLSPVLGGGVWSGKASWRRHPNRQLNLEQELPKEEAQYGGTCQLAWASTAYMMRWGREWGGERKADPSSRILN